MVGSVRVVLLLPALVIGTITNVVATSVDQVVQQRHNAPPLHQTTAANILAYPHSQNSALMTSPCRPERDGYFGGTSSADSSSTSDVQYAFELETMATTTSDGISRALDIVREHVMDVVVSTTFPAICGSTTRRDLSGLPTNAVTTDIAGITGYKFGLEYDALDACLPVYTAGATTAMTQDDYCGVFVGRLTVYGTAVSESVLTALLDTILQQLPTVSTAAQLQSLGVLRLGPSRDHSQILIGPSGTTSHGSDQQRHNSFLSTPALIGMIIFVAILLVGKCILLRYVCLEYSNHVKNRRNDRSKTLPNSASQSGAAASPWLHRFLGFVDTMDCDSTQVSNLSLPSTTSSSSFYVSRSTRHSMAGAALASSSKAANTTSRGARLSTRHPVPKRPPMSHCNEELDSIYIVEPDDDDDNPDLSPREWQQHQPQLHFYGEYGADPLATTLVTMRDVVL